MSDNTFEDENEKGETIGFPENAVVMGSEPLTDISVSDVRHWLNENDTELGLATALAKVNNKTGWLMHDLDELEEAELSKAKAAINEWWTLETELYEKIISILKAENTSGKANHTFTEKGLYYVVKPFMERNGYRDGAGWWVCKKASRIS